MGPNALANEMGQGKGQKDCKEGKKKKKRNDYLPSGLTIHIEKVKKKKKTPNC